MAEPASARRILIIGIGNTLRRDDGAGWLFAEEMTAELRNRGCQVHLELQHQLTPELALVAAEFQPTSIVFVDASIMVAAPTRSPLRVPSTVSDSVHALSPEAIMAIVARLYDVEAAGWLVQTPATDLGHGEGLSEPARHALRDAPALAAALLASSH